MSYIPPTLHHRVLTFPFAKHRLLSITARKTRVEKSSTFSPPQSLTPYPLVGFVGAPLSPHYITAQISQIRCLPPPPISPFKPKPFTRPYYVQPRIINLKRHPMHEPPLSFAWPFNPSLFLFFFNLFGRESFYIIHTRRVYYLYGIYLYIL